MNDQQEKKYLYRRRGFGYIILVISLIIINLILRIGILELSRFYYHLAGSEALITGIVCIISIFTLGAKLLYGSLYLISEKTKLRKIFKTPEPIFFHKKNKS